MKRTRWQQFKRDFKAWTIRQDRFAARHYVTAVAVLLTLSMPGCVLVPNSIRPEVQHMSHAMQHVGPDQTHYGANTLELMAHWDIKKIAYFEMGEGIALDKQSGCKQYQDQGYGEIIGPREQFIARVVLVVPLK